MKSLTLIFLTFFLLQGCDSNNEHQYALDTPNLDLDTIVDIEANPASLVLKANEAADLSVKAVLKDGSKLIVDGIWRAANTSLVSVNSNKITAGSQAGYTTLTVNYHAPNGLVFSKDVSVAVTSLSTSPTDTIGLKVNPGTLILHAGESANLQAFAILGDGSEKAVTASLTSADTSIASISGSSVTAGSNTGQTLLTATYQTTGKQTFTQVIPVTVLATSVSPTEIVGLRTTPSLLVLQSGQNIKIQTLAILGDGTAKLINGTWHSSDTSVVSVNGETVIAGSNAGIATLTVSFKTVAGKLLTQDIAATVLASAALPTDIIGLKATPAILTLQIGKSANLQTLVIMGDGSTQAVTGTWTSANNQLASINGESVVAGSSVGQTSITVTYLTPAGTSLSEEVPVIVLSSSHSPTDIIGLSVIPDILTLETDHTITLQSYITLGDGSKQAVVSDFISGSTVIASVQGQSVTAGSNGGHTSLVASFHTADGKTLHQKVPVTVLSPAVLESDIIGLKVIPEVLVMITGESTTLQAFTVMGDGTMQAVTASWSTSDTNIAAINADVVTASSTSGHAILGVHYVTPDGRVFSQDIPATILDPAISPTRIIGLNVNPNVYSLQTGETANLKAFAVLGDGSKQAVTGTWVSQAPTVASVIGETVTAGNFAGHTSVTVTFLTPDGRTLIQSASVSVHPPRLLSLSISNCATTVSKGLTFSCTVLANYENSTSSDVSLVASLITDDHNILFIDASTKIVRAVAKGQAVLTYSWAGLTGSILINVTTPNIVSLATNKDSFSIPENFTEQLHVWAEFTDNSRIEVTSSATYSVDSPTIISVSANGLITGNTPGKSNINITYQGISTSSPIPVNVENKSIQSIHIIPARVHIPQSYSQTFTAIAIFSDGTSSDISQLAIWNSDVSKLTFNSNKATAIAPGNIDVTATFLTATSSISHVSISNPVLTSVNITPPNALVPIGFIQHHKAIGHYNDGSTLDLTTHVNWSSADQNKLESQSFGAFKAKALGTIKVTAIDPISTIAGSTDDTVTGKKVVSLTPDPPLIYLPAGLTQQINIIAKWNDDSESTLHPDDILWKKLSDNPLNSSTPLASTINISGLLSAVASGTSQYMGLAAGLESEKVFAIITSPGVFAFSVAFVDANGDFNPDDTFPAGTDSQLKLISRYSDGSDIEVTTSGAAACSSTNTQVASINLNKTVHGVATGNTTITCNFEGFVVTIPVTITPAKLISISASANRTTLRLPQASTLTVIGTYTDASTRDLTQEVNYHAINNAPSYTGAQVLTQDSSVTKNQFIAYNIGDASIEAFIGPPHADTRLAASVNISTTFSQRWYWRGNTFTWGRATDTTGYRANIGCPSGFVEGGNHFKEMGVTFRPWHRFKMDLIPILKGSDDPPLMRYFVNHPVADSVFLDTGVLYDSYYASLLFNSCKLPGRHP